MIVQLIEADNTQKPPTTTSLSAWYVNLTLAHFKAITYSHITSIGFEVFSKSPNYEKRKKLRR